jgi:hypothetical protein
MLFFWGWYYKKSKMPYFGGAENLGVKNHHHDVMNIIKN